ncbi:MAG: ABC transporter ATP-binding protein [Sumerlaeia bacterium]
MKSDTIVELANCHKKLGSGSGPAVEFLVESLQLQAGEFLALTGPSGCGKSTCLNLVSGLISPDAGTVNVFGKSLKELSTRQLDSFRSMHMGFVYQSFHLLDAFTALENVLLGLKFGRSIQAAAQRERAKQLLEQVGLGHRLNAKPHRLSVGERQRVAIARALANKPQLILADEPTGALDPTTADSVTQLLFDSCRETGTALLMVTHDLQLAQKLDRQIDCRAFILANQGAGA